MSGGRTRGGRAPSPGWTRDAGPGAPAAGQPIRSSLVWDDVLLIAGVVLAPLPALVLGARGLFRHRGYVAGKPGDRMSVVVLVTLRVLVWLLVLALSAITLVSCIGALAKGVELHGMVLVFFVLDLLLAALVLLTFGRTEKRPARRPVTPAAR